MHQRTKTPAGARDFGPRGDHAMERKLLQITVAAAGLAGVCLGLTGVLFGTMYADLSGDVVMDSYVRFLKGCYSRSA